MEPWNDTAAVELTSSFFGAETAAVQALFNSLSISTADSVKLSTKSLIKADVMARYEERFALVFDYVFISVRDLKLFYQALINDSRLASRSSSWQ